MTELEILKLKRSESLYFSCSAAFGAALIGIITAQDPTPELLSTFIGIAGTAVSIIGSTYSMIQAAQADKDIKRNTLRFKPSAS